MSKASKSKFEMAVINRITEMRKERGFSQEDIATLLGFTRGFIGQIESPNFPSKYNLDHVNRLAYEFGCSPQDFIPSKSIVEKDWDI